MRHRLLTVLLALGAALAPISRAAADVIDDLAAPSADPALSFDLSESIAHYAQPPQPGGPPKPAPEPEHPKAYGKAGSRWWTIGAAYENDFQHANDFNVHLAFSQFLTDDLEFAVEAAGW